MPSPVILSIGTDKSHSRAVDGNTLIMFSARAEKGGRAEQVRLFAWLDMVAIGYGERHVIRPINVGAA
jgi:hypothetical protein